MILHVHITMLHVDISELHANRNTWHVDIIYRSFRGQKYANIYHRNILSGFIL